VPGGRVELAVRGLIKRFSPQVVVGPLSFEVMEGEFFSLLGPSGCGKTTTLRCIAGFETPSEGSISLDGRRLDDRPPHRRDVGLVFQNYALFPHLTVFDNVAFGLRLRKAGSAEIARRVTQMLSLVDLPDLGERYPAQLSGGQQQRVAIARSLVLEPRLLLFDEPLSNLDLKLREQMRLELKRIQQEVGITTVFVTHDQAEALVMSDEIIVMREGGIEQKGRPHEIYSRPVNRYVSNFIGAANLVAARVVEVTAPERGTVEISGCGSQVRLPCRLAADMAAGEKAILSVRPENVRASHEPAGGPCLEGEVLQVIFLGNCVDCRVRWGELEWKVLAHPRARLRTGEKVYLRLDPEHTLAVHP